MGYNNDEWKKKKYFNNNKELLIVPSYFSPTNDLPHKWKDSLLLPQVQLTTFKTKDFIVKMFIASSTTI